MISEEQQELSRLARAVERLVTQHESVHERLQEFDIVLHSETRRLREAISGIEERFVTRHQFQPVRMIAYGLVTIIATAVVIALMAVIMIPGFRG